MTTIKATVRGGRLEVDEPIDLPDGTELHIPIPVGGIVDDGTMSPDEIARVLQAMEQIEPFELTNVERTAWETERQAQKDREKAEFVEHGEKLRRLWDDPISAR